MESSKPLVQTTLTGANYLVWAKTIQIALSSKGLWEDHVERSEVPTEMVKRPGRDEPFVMDKTAWFQEDQMVLSILQNTLSPALLESYYHCATAKSLWDALYKLLANDKNLIRVYEVKKTLNELRQGDVEFQTFFGKFQSLWTELEVLRPATVEPSTLMERREQDKIFGLLMALNPVYSDLIKHILRSPTLGDLDDVCAQLKQEGGSFGLFGSKGDEMVMVNKASFRQEDRKVPVCEHCKKRGHIKEKCWILHPHLKINLGNNTKWKEARANFSHEQADGGASSKPATSNAGGEESFLSGTHELVSRSDLQAILKALKDGGNSGITLSASHKLLKPLIVDSGASHHMISDSKLITNIKPVLGNVEIANGTRVPIEGLGDLRLFDRNSKAFYMPKFTSNLLSVKRATTDLDCLAIFSPNDVHFQDIKTRKTLGKGVSRGDLYVLEDTKPSTYLSCSFSSIRSDSDPKNKIWHARLGHPHARALSLLFPSISFKNEDCEACILGKHCRTVFHKSSTIYDKCFDLVHSDVWTAPSLSRENHKYFVTFIDEKSKFTWVTLIQTKDKVLEAFMNFQSYITNQYNAKIKIFRSDNGGEYTSHAFKQHLTKHGIFHQTSCPYTPQQNGVAERKNRHLMEVARSMMFHNNVPKRFWGDALVSACYLINRIPTRVLHDQTPFEVLNKTKPFLDHLRVFGCVCFVLVPGEQRNKLDAKSVKAMFIGYSSTQKGYKCYDPNTRRVMVSRDVKFLETKGFYEEKDWDELQDLVYEPSDRAFNLRQVLESLGIPEFPRAEAQTTPQPSSRPSPSAPTVPLDPAEMSTSSSAEDPPLDRVGDTQTPPDHHDQEDSHLHDQECEICGI